MPVIAYLGYALGATFLAISAAVNVRFGLIQGHETFDKVVFTASAVAVDVLKILIPVIAIACWRQQHRLLAGACGLLWAGAIAWSMSGALGWSATSRSGVSSEAAAYAGKYQRATAEVDSLESQIAALSPHRAARIVEAAIATNDVQRYIYDRTGQCTTFQRDADKRACQGVQDLRRELAVSNEAVSLNARLARAKAAIAAMPAPAEEADPQAEALARNLGWLIGYDPAVVRSRVALLLSLLIEAASALIFTATWIATAAPPPAPPQPPVSEPVAVTGTAVAIIPVSEPATAPRHSPERFCTTDSYPDTEPPPQPPATPRRARPATARVSEPDTAPVTAPATGVWRGTPLDVVDIWAQHRLDVAAGAEIKTSVAYADYLDWTVEQGMQPLSNQQFGVQAEPVIERMGGRKLKRRDARYFVGVDLTEKVTS